MQKFWHVIQQIGIWESWIPQYSKDRILENVAQPTQTQLVRRLTIQKTEKVSSLLAVEMQNVK